MLRRHTRRTNQRTPDPPHNQGMSRPDSSHTATRKETGPRREDNYTLTTHPSRACSEDARVHYADLKQQPHQPPHPRITAWLPTPQGLSQAPTSFIGSWYQDIHRLPLVACHNKKLRNHKTLQRDARVHYTVLKIRAGTPTPNHHLSSRRLKHQGNNTPRSRHPHQRFGESRPQPPIQLSPVEP